MDFIKQVELKDWFLNFTDILKKFFFPNEVFSKFGGIVEDVLDNFDNFLTDHINVRWVIFSSHNEFSDEFVFFGSYPSFVILEEVNEFSLTPGLTLSSFLKL